MLSRDSPWQNGILTGSQILGLFLTYENLIENRIQTEQNDVNKANDQQAKYLLEELRTLFNQQNETLSQQNEMLGTIMEDLARIKYYLGIR